MSGSTTSAKLETPRTYIEVRKKVEAGIVDCDFGADPVKKVPGPTDPDPYEVRKNFEEMLRMATLADWP